MYRQFPRHRYFREGARQLLDLRRQLIEQVEEGKRLGRPRVDVDVARVTSLRGQGPSWVRIANDLGIGEGTVRRAAQASAQILSENSPTNVVFSAPAETRVNPPQSFASGLEGAAFVAGSHLFLVPHPLVLSIPRLGAAQRRRSVSEKTR
jgi:hypothetical protein